jgi:hypothetical protein
MENPYQNGENYKYPLENSYFLINIWFLQKKHISLQ